ncbi:MAG: D-glycerate dehydrogenase [Chloroflexi bacterium]|nr:D-glycerate dehydrogenase [Chloroflexota bacterium]
MTPTGRTSRPAALVDLLITPAFPTPLVERLAAGFTFEQVQPDVDTARAELLARVGRARALCSTGADRIDAELLDAAPELLVVANFGVGYDGVDVVAAADRGVWVANTPDVLTESTADVALLLLLGTLRRAGEGFEHVRHGRWKASDPGAFWGVDPGGLTLGILGMGRIGQALAARVAPLGMRTIYHNRTRLAAEREAELAATWVPLDELLERADVVSLHVPLSAETRGLIGRPQLARMRRGVFIINTARGALVDEAALIEALGSGHVAGVGLDVFAREPRVPRALREHPGAFLLPHLGSATRRTREAMMRLCLENAVAVLRGGRPSTPVNEPRPDRARARARR